MILSPYDLEENWLCRRRYNAWRHDIGPNVGIRPALNYGIRGPPKGSIYVVQAHPEVA